MAQESPKQKAGGMAYEVILAPASTDAAPRPSSPPKDRPLSQEVIEQKLKDAEERRLSVEASKLAAIAKDKERAQEAVKRVEELNDSFSKTAEKRLSAKFEAAEVKKDQHYKELQDRLKEHAKRVEEVRQAGDKYKEQIRDRIDRKMEVVQENRSAQLNAITDRLREHEKHIQTVLEASQKMNKQDSQKREKYMEKMETTLKNREEQLGKLFERLQEHEKRSEQVRQNKLANQSSTEEAAEEASSS